MGKGSSRSLSLPSCRQLHPKAEEPSLLETSSSTLQPQAECRYLAQLLWGAHHLQNQTTTIFIAKCDHSALTKISIFKPPCAHTCLFVPPSPHIIMTSWISLVFPFCPKRPRQSARAPSAALGGIRVSQASPCSLTQHTNHPHTHPPWPRKSCCRKNWEPQAPRQPRPQSQQSLALESNTNPLV